MNFKSEKGFITEMLTICIIVMLIILGGFLVYSYNMDRYLEKDMNTTVAEEYSYNKTNNENKIENAIINSTDDEINYENTKVEYNLNDILQSYNSYSTNTTNNSSSNVQNNNYENDYKRYYYNQLDSYAKEIYDVINDNKNNLKSGTYSMDIPGNVSDILYLDNGKELLKSAFQDAIDAFKSDNPDLFYIAFNKILLVTETTTVGSRVTYKLNLENKEGDTYLLPNFNNQASVTNAIAELERKRDEILNSAVGSDYDKIKYIHDWLVDNIVYDSTISRDNTHNIYGALVEKEVVCDGYARALKYLLDEINIPCVIVQGIATNSDGVSESHAWNYVRLYGKWYAIDTTWDDPIIEGWSIFHKDTKYVYFLKGLNSIYDDHTEIGRISEEGREFLYPNLSYDDYE